MISVIIPAYNEEQNVGPLYKAVKRVLSKKPHEIIFVDDGSTDGTFEVLKKIHAQDKSLKIVKFRRNFGQTAGLMAGINAAKGDIVVTMDADLQNDPEDIPRMIEKLDTYDVVLGWRYERHDTFFKRNFSKFGRLIRRVILGDKMHDSGCALRVCKKEALKGIELYGEMHRYLHLLVAHKGFKVGELRVRHHSRKYGKTKYNSKRLIKGLLDLLFVKFWNGFSTRPLHVFGALGLLQYFISFIIFVEQVVKSFIVGEVRLGPLLLLVVMLLVTGTLFILFGFLGEILIRSYYGKDRPPYVIEKIVT